MLVSSAAALFLCAASLDAQLKAVRFAAVVDGSGAVTRRGVVIVSGDTILRVARPNDPIPQGAQVIDLSRYTAIPGLIDVHTHMTYYWDSTSGTDPWRQPARQPEQTVQLARWRPNPATNMRGPTQPALLIESRSAMSV